MDRDYVLTLTRNSVFDRNVSYQDVYQVLYNYCIEFGKNPKLTQSFIEIFKADIIKLSLLFSIALEYYRKKYNICILQKKEQIIAIF